MKPTHHHHSSINPAHISTAYSNGSNWFEKATASIFTIVAPLVSKYNSSKVIKKSYSPFLNFSKKKKNGLVYNKDLFDMKHY